MYKTDIFNIENCDVEFTIEDLECLNIVKQDDDLDFITNTHFQAWMASFKTYVIFGTGGSSLGAQAIHAISKKERNIIFMNNTDSDTLRELFDKLDLSNTGFLCISKSGETLETICQTLLVIDRIEDIKKHVIIVTENKQSTLKKIAQTHECLCFDHPKNIGGRFSVFSIVGMIPAYMCGIDPRKIRNGARAVLADAKNHVESSINFMKKNIAAQKSSHISFVYSDKLSIFGSWLSQLYAESTGKDTTGITSIISKGSIDQHSHLQLYLDGPQDKCFTFFVEKQESILRLPRYDLGSYNYIIGKYMSEIFEAQANATAQTLIENGNAVRFISFKEVTPEILGELFMHFMLEVIAVCRILNVNPFDQPAVERGKILTKELLQ